MRVPLALVLALLLALSAAPASAQAGCSFQNGFKALADQIPDVVGRCTSAEYVGVMGYVEQQTTTGLLVWGQAANRTAFIDGYRTWVIGPYGLQTRLNSERFDWEPGGAVHAPEPTTAQPPPSRDPSAELRSACFVDVTNIVGVAQTFGAVPNDPAGAQAAGEARCQEAFLRDGNRGYQCFRFAYLRAFLKVRDRGTTSAAIFWRDYGDLYAGCLGTR